MKLQASRAFTQQVGQTIPADRPPQRSGTVLVMFALILAFLLLLVAFAVDVGRITLIRSEMQSAVDSSALAARLKLQTNPQGIQQAEDIAKEYVRMHEVGSTLIPPDSIEVEVGVWDPVNSNFTATTVDANAVRVFARQDKEPYIFGKVWGHKTFNVPASAIATSSTDIIQDIMMVLDLSGSMAYMGRIEALRSAAPVFVDVIESQGGDDQIGVMGLSANPSDFNPQKSGHKNSEYNSGLHPTSGHHVGVLEYELTSNFGMLKSAGLNKNKLVASKYNGWTGTGAALGDAVHYLIHAEEGRQGAKKIVVLMSDGHANRPAGYGPEYARQMARYAKEQAVIVHTISLGNEADLELMADIARITGGKHFQAQGASEFTLVPRLIQAFKDVAGEIKSTRLVR